MRCPFSLLALAVVPAAALAANASADFVQAGRHAEIAREGFERCNRYLNAWLAAAEPTTGLIPRNLKDSPYWNGMDSAADNYPFMVLSGWFTDRALFNGKLRAMLDAEIKLTARPGWLRLTDHYNLRDTPRLRFPEPNAERIIFGSAEYVKDGLLAMTEWLGPSAWSERMFALIDDSFALAAVETPFGKVPLAGRNKEVGVEVSGDHLQALARIYWLSGRQEKYLEWGARLADLYLLPEGKHHPTRDFTGLRLRDHGCEITSGLCEFYATLHFAGQHPGGDKWKAKREAYRPHLHEMLDRILAVGRNADGLLYNEVNPQTGQVIDSRVSDSWGYVFDAFYTIFLIDGTTAYRDAALKPLGALEARYRGFPWEPSGNAPNNPKGSMDGYADAIESALNLVNRLPPEDARATSAYAWIDSEMRELWSYQRTNGIIEGWHGDGNFARTTLMYCLWKTQGVSVHPWRADVRVGAVRRGGRLHVSIATEQPWQGSLIFDRPRHRESLHLPIDWPRINQFPEWFTVAAGRDYTVERVGAPRPEKFPADKLRTGLALDLPANGVVRLTVRE
jgi:hypothetical protein